MLKLIILTLSRGQDEAVHLNSARLFFKKKNKSMKDVKPKATWNKPLHWTIEKKKKEIWILKHRHTILHRVFRLLILQLSVFAFAKIQWLTCTFCHSCSSLIPIRTFAKTCCTFYYYCHLHCNHVDVSLHCSIFCIYFIYFFYIPLSSIFWSLLCLFMVTQDFPAFVSLYIFVQ